MGRQLEIHAGVEGPFEVVGIVGNVKHASLESIEEPMLYVPTAQHPFRSMSIAVRTHNAPLTLVATVRQEVGALDANLPVYALRTMNQVVASTAGERRFAMVLLAVFAGLALLLAAVGVYGVTAFTVQQRRSEFGVRMALGAQRRDILGLVLGQGMLLTGVGLIVGCSGALLLSRSLESLLFGIGKTDPLTFLGVTLVLALISSLAGYVPARRATRVDPAVVLRNE